ILVYPPPSAPTQEVQQPDPKDDQADDSDKNLADDALVKDDQSNQPITNPNIPRSQSPQRPPITDQAPPSGGTPIPLIPDPGGGVVTAPIPVAPDTQPTIPNIIPNTPYTPVAVNDSDVHTDTGGGPCNSG
ncbi:MAG: hypothetical protein OXC40_01155, partial [Proteobacteria bacterium]|nr:hypothetical protein [Pseudomonadota bacterium]